MADYEPTSAFEVFGRYMTIGDVHEAVTLILMDGGPKDGWVYDITRAGKEEHRGEPGTFTYEDVVELGKLEDGRIVRIYRPA